jgi:hypothetical protein
MLVIAGLVILVAVVVAVADGRAEATEPAADRGAQAAAAPLQQFRSPLPEVADDEWTRFVRLMATGRATSVTAGGHLGIFGFGLKRLQDLGLVRASRRVAREGRVVWEADWVPPHSLEGFLSNGGLQYRTFAKHMSDLRGRILDRHGSAIGKVFASKRATLSGLLAVAHQAGLQGLARWLDNEGDRQRFPHTTAAFIKASGVF